MEVFFQDTDYEAYLDILKKQCEEHGVEIWSYCLMSNHIHLIAVPKEPESLAKAIGNTQYALALYQDDKFPGRMERILVAGEVLILCNG